MLITVLGNLGSGKTLFLVMNAYFSPKLDIVSNFKLKFENRPYIPFDLKKFLRCEYDNCIILLDEAYNYIESRISTNEINRIMSYMLFQSRKKNVTIYITAQLFSTIDRRYRELSDMIVTAENTSDFNYTINFGAKTKRFSISKENAKQFFDMYDTNEVIKLVDKKTTFDLKKGSDKMSEIELYALEIIEYYKSEEIENVTRNLVDLYFTSKDYPKFLEKDTFTMIKLIKDRKSSKKKSKKGKKD